MSRDFAVNHVLIQMNMDDEGSLSRQAKASLARSNFLSQNASDMKSIIDEGQMLIAMKSYHIASYQSY